MEGGRVLAVSPHFNLLVSLSDCTGEIEGVWLGGKAASELLGYTVSLSGLLKRGMGTPL